MLGKNAKIELLKRVPLFAGCSQRELGEIAAVADELYLPDDRALTIEGGKGREFIVLVEGQADVMRKDRAVNKLGPGDFIGEIALVTDKPRTATVRTRGPARILALDATSFRRLLRDVPSLQTKVLTAIAERLPSEYD
jgi:CRP/FNR family transcriptional regulator, cyclic AMP receptor protein